MLASPVVALPTLAVVAIMRPSALPVAAQETRGAIQGHVSDSSGGSIGGDKYHIAMYVGGGQMIEAPQHRCELGQRGYIDGQRPAAPSRPRGRRPRPSGPRAGGY